jgi:cytochrome P450
MIATSAAAATALPDAPRFPFGRECPFHPPSLYAQARRDGPLFAVTLWNGRRAWLVTRHEEIRAVLMDDARFSGAMAHPDFPTVTEARVTVDRNERAFVGMDNPAHDHYRRMFTREFSVRRMLALRPQIEAIAATVIDELVAHGPPADLAGTLAVKFPSLVMSALIGSPYEDHRFIIDCAVGRHGLTQTPGEALEKARALAAYFRRLIDAKEAAPGDDLVSRVIESHVKPGHLSRDDFAEIGAMLLRAGHDTTTNMIGMGMLLCLRDEDLRRRAADPASVDAAVEELLRFITPVQFSPRRVALEDVEIGGVTVRKGEDSSCCSPRRIATRACSPIPTGSTARATRPTTSPSATASTSASGRPWRATSCRSSIPRCSAGYRACGSPCRSRKSASRTICRSTACIICRSRGRSRG